MATAGRAPAARRELTDTWDYSSHAMGSARYATLTISDCPRVD